MSNSIQTDISAMNASRNIKIHQKNIQRNMKCTEIMCTILKDS